MPVLKRLTSEERRRRIVQAAMQEFARTGLKAARTRELARAAGVSEALLFKYFPTKRALQKAIIEERIRQTGEPIRPEWRQSPPAEVLARLAAFVIQSCTDDPTFMRLLLFSSLEGEPLAPMFFQRRVVRNIESLVGLFKTWIERGQIRNTLDPRFAAWSFMGIVYQLMVTRHIYGVKRLEDHPGDQAAKIVEIFLRGIQP